ncbi:hypothetical protein COE51_16465 [Bacillus pseudomycoides]|nr:hypothetical protein COE51_16465 [Bacillus pseudomycoides]
MNKKVFKKWTAKEIGILKSNCNLSYDELQKLFPDRSIKSIKHKITNMNLPREKEYSRYSKEEDEVIKNNLHLPVVEVQKLIPHRTIESIIQRYNYLGLEWTKTWDFWTDEEINIIKKYDTIEEMAAYLPNRTKEGIYTKAKKMGKYFNDFWTIEELAILKENYGTRQVSNFIHLLPKRNEQAIYNKANDLGIKGIMGRFDVSDEVIIDLYNEGNCCAEIAKILAITITTVTNRLKKNNIPFERKFISGEDHYFWKGGITPENIKIRNSIEYKQWRISVFERDSYTCQCCGDNKGHNLHAHHIENFSANEDKRFDVDNGIALCNDCHNPSVEGSFHHVYGTHNNNQEQLDEYLKSRQ